MNETIPLLRRTVDKLYDLQLQRDVAIINARTAAELGPLPLGGLPVVPKRKPNFTRHNLLESSQAYQDEEQDMLRINRAAAVAALSVGLVACNPKPAASQDPTQNTASSAGTRTSLADGDEELHEKGAGSDIEQSQAANVPNEVIAMLKPKDVLLAYRESSPDKEDQVAVAVIGHDLKPDSNDIKENPCTMLIMDSERRVLFENDKVVDCTYNEGNQKALPLELTDDLTVESNIISFVNENIRGGSYGYTFGFSKEKNDWYLLSARSVYKRAEPSEDGYVVMVEEKVRYPDNIKYITFRDFDPEMISENLQKNATFIE